MYVCLCACVRVCVCEAQSYVSSFVLVSTSPRYKIQEALFNVGLHEKLIT